VKMIQTMIQSLMMKRWNTISVGAKVQVSIACCSIALHTIKECPSRNVCMLLVFSGSLIIVLDLKLVTARCLSFPFIVISVGSLVFALYFGVDRGRTVEPKL
jgi:hypothetical protein